MRDSWPPQKRGEENPRAKLTADQVELMRERHEMAGVTYRQLAEEIGISHTTIRKWLNRECNT